MPSCSLPIFPDALTVHLSLLSAFDFDFDFDAVSSVICQQLNNAPNLTMNYRIPLSQPSITALEVACVTDAVESGWVSSRGEYIDRFEEIFADYCGTKYALTTSSGTTAIHLALLAYGIEPGDEVSVPDMTFIATANAVTYTGAKPVFVDVDRDTLCLDVTKVAQAITPKT